MIVFDVDGVLIDSAELITESYLKAGALPPEDILSQEGTNWLVKQVGTSLASLIYPLKTFNYLAGLPDVALLPPVAVVQRLYRCMFKVGVATAAPTGTLAALRRRIQPWPFTAEIEDARTPMKMHFLSMQMKMQVRDLHGREGVYVDDQDRSHDVPAGWRFVHYVGQTNDQLYREIVG